MQITAKLIQLLPLQTGTSKNGEWKKQDVILETEGTYPKKVCVSFWGDKIDEKSLQPGNMLKIEFDIESREYNGRWYTDLKAWKVEVDTANSGENTMTVPAITTEKSISGPPITPLAENKIIEDDLPF